VVSNLTSAALGDAIGHVLQHVVERLLNRAGALANHTGHELLEDVFQGIDRLFPSLTGPHGGVSRGPFREVQASGTTLIELSDVAARTSADADSLHTSTGRVDLELREDGVVLESMKSRFVDELEAEGFRDAWERLVETLRTLASILPTTVNTMKLARREVSKLSTGLDTVFRVLDERGGKLFDTVASFWRTLWVLYFCSLLPLNLYILYYGFWAGGFFGGPTPLTPEEERLAGPPKSFGERLSLCYTSCSHCMKQYHDTHLCFWSAILLLQVVVLIIFVVSMLLCALAGIKAFVLAGCAQMYVLGDETVCRQRLLNVKDFLSSFFITEAIEPLQDACGNHKLLTCNLIEQKMLASTVLTTVFSFVGTLVCLQILVDSAVMHEQARWRRLANAALVLEKQGAEASGADPSDVPSVP